MRMSTEGKRRSLSQGIAGQPGPLPHPYLECMPAPPEEQTAVPIWAPKPNDGPVQIMGEFRDIPISHTRTYQQLSGWGTQDTVSCLLLLAQGGLGGGRSREPWAASWGLGVDSAL